MRQPRLIYTVVSVAIVTLLFSMQAGAVITQVNSSSATATTVSSFNTITHVGTGARSELSDCGALTPAITAGAAGDLLIASIIARDTGTDITTTPVGWILYTTSTYTGQNLKAFIYYRITVAASETVTFTTSNSCGSTGAIVTRFNNVDSADPIFPAAGGAIITQSNSNNITTGTVDTTTVAPNAMMIVSSYINDNNSINNGDVNGNGYTESFDESRNVADDYGHAMHYALQTTAGNKSVSNWSTNNTDENIDVIYALRPSSTTTNPTGLTLTVPTGTATGNVMIAMVAVTGNLAIGTPAGWTAVAAQQNQGTATSNAQRSYYRVATGADNPGVTTYTWTFTAVTTDGAGAIVTYSGVDTSASPIDVSNRNNTASSLSHQANQVTTTVAETMLVGSHSISSSVSWTAPAGMAPRANIASRTAPANAGISLLMSDVIVTNVGLSGNKIATVGSFADTGVASLLALIPLDPATATVTTAATGGSALSADTSPAGTGTYTALTGPVIAETTNKGMLTGSYTLTAPPGYAFATTANSVTITIGTVSGTGTSLNLGAGAGAAVTVTPTASTITFNVTAVSTNNLKNSLTFSGIQVRPTASCPLSASGNIVFATATTTTITSSNAGTLTEVAGVAARMYTVMPGQAAYGNTSCGTISGTPADQYEDVLFNISQLVVTDQFGNIQTGYDNAGVTITYVYGGPGSPSFTSPVNFTDGVATTVLATTLDTAAAGITITATASGLTGIASSAFNVLATPPLPAAVVIYDMEQSSWDGTPGEVLDTSGNNLHGNALNGPDTSNAISAIPGDPGTCNYGVFDQVDDLIQTADNPLLDITNTLTVTSWIYTFTYPGADLKSIVSKDQNYEYHLNPTGRVYWWWGGGARSLTSSTIIPQNEWHHIAVVYNNGNATIYIDGVADATTNDGFGTLTTNNNPLEIAADQSFAGRNFDGWIDEVRVYNAALSAPQINVLKSETHPCAAPPTFPTLVAGWTLDGPNWTGTGDTLLDISGNGYNGTTNNTANILGFVCNASDLSANANNDYLTINNAAMDTLTDFSISVWARTNNTGQQYLMSAAGGTEPDELQFWFPSSTLFRPSVAGDDNNPGTDTIDIPDIADGQWHHLVWTRSGGSNCIIVDTVSYGCLDRNSAALDIDFLFIGQEQDSVGNTFNANDDWEGDVDEPLIYSGVLSAADIQTIYLNQVAGNNYDGSQRDCPVVQYNINHDGTGMSCLAETITITAIDAHGDTTDPGNITINLSVDPVSGSPAINPPPAPKGTWARLISAGNLSNNNNTNGSADVQFPGDGSSSVQLAFNYTAMEAGNTLETINFDVDDLTNNKTDTRNSSAITDPDMSFSLAGFQFYNYDTGNELIPTQIAGKPSNVAPLDNLIALRAMRVSDDDPSVCEAAFPDGSNVTIPIGAECRNPANCSARQVLINSTAINTNNDNSAAGTTSYTDVMLSFEDDGTASGITRAPLEINYPDVGNIQLHARYEVPLDDGGSPPTGPGSGGYMEGSSQQFIVRPFGLAITDIMAGATANPGSLTVAGAKFTSAGSDFSVRLGAYLWEANDDDGNPWGTANDGIPDFRLVGSFYEGVNITDNNTLVGSALAPNFAWNGSLSAFVNYAPAGGVLGALGNGAVVSGDFNGAGEAIINDLNYSEVGTFLILATFNDYLGDPTVDILGASAWNGQLDSDSNPTGAVGRFVPYDFDVSVNTPEFGAECGAFSYVGQPFEFTTDPVLTVTARAEGGVPTVNYTGSFNRLTSGSVSFPGGTDEGFLEGSVDMIGLDTGLISGWLPTITDQGAGLTDLTFSFGVGEQITFNRITPLAPFDAEISLGLNVVDLDGVFFGDGAGANLNPAKFGDTGAGQGIAFDTDKEQRWGRLTMTNAFGSELLPVTLNLQAEYYLDDDTGFVANSADNCTVYQAADINILDVNLSDTLTTADVAVLVPVAPTSLVNGVHNTADPVLLSSAGDSSGGPGGGKTGTMQLTLDLSALTGSVQDWLQFDWDDTDNLNNGPYDDNPSARATFGIYKGSKDFIYIREPWN